ncbi:MAG: AsmA family protein [Ferrovum sp.]|nr:AsmA family protein [Ferrovum sp.]
MVENFINSVLTLDPLKFGVAGGTLAGSITLNGQHDPIQAKLNIRARKILLNQLFPTTELTKTSIGQLNGNFDLTGSGNAVNQMLANADGKVILLVDGGKISKLMMEKIGLHLWEILQLKITGDKVINLNCAVTDFDVKQGIMQTKVMVLDTPVTTIIGSGDINLAQETLNLDLQPHTKVFSPLALHSPIYIRGKFSEPEVSLDKTKLALRSTGALILGVINPFLAIIPLVDTGPGKNSECGRLIYAAKH